MSLMPVATDYNLVLTGSIGPTQLIIARRVAERLKLRFVDAEQQIERRAEMPLDQFKGLFGEARLRALESDIVAELALYRGAVLHIPGQILASGDHYGRMQASSYILCLVAALDAVLTRLHVALGARYHDPSERALALGALRRDWLIRQRPGITEFDTTALREDEMVEQISAHWAKQVIEFTRLA